MSNREQELNAKIVQQKQNAKLAKLMRWYKTTNPFIYNDPSDDSFIWVVDKDFTPRTPHKRFLPSSDIADAMRVIEWMRKEREFFITIVPQMDGYLLAASDYQPIGNYYCHLCNSRADTFEELPDAICQIILETVEADKYF